MKTDKVTHMQLRLESNKIVRRCKMKNNENARWFWWVLGALILMPLGLGMANMIFQIGTTQWLSLMGHLIYGMVTGLLFVVLSRRK